jgi:hypothetical protein
MSRRRRDALRRVVAVLAGVGGAAALIVGLPPGLGWALLLIALALTAAPTPQARPARASAQARRHHRRSHPTRPAHRRRASRPRQR